MNDKVYIAGPLFTQGDRWFLEKLMSCCKTMDL